MRNIIWSNEKQEKTYAFRSYEDCCTQETEDCEYEDTEGDFDFDDR